MSAKQNKRDIEAQLEDLSKSYDDFYEKLRTARTTSKGTYSFPQHIKVIGSLLMDFHNNLWPLITSGFGGIALIWGTVGFDSLSLEYKLLSWILFVLILVWYYDRKAILLSTNASDENFNLDAYRKYREEDFIRHYDYFYDQLFSFKELLDDFNAVVGDNDIVEREFFINTLKEKDEEIEELSKSLVITTESMEMHEYRSKISLNTLRIFDFLAQGRLDYKDLHFGVDFAIYKVEEDHLSLQEKDAVDYIFEKRVPLNTDHHLTNVLNKKPKEYVVERERHITWYLEPTSTEKYVVTLPLNERDNDKLNPYSELGKMNIRTVVTLMSNFIVLIGMLNDLAGNGEDDNDKES
ncbi:hypothetical protein [Halobacillus sp. B23F22_1]|uniref:hypothetical protein n=1 Tax=Halobacillus sp. B23F22_1 TaxID=3459514 RepID=UPI00373EFC31